MAVKREKNIKEEKKDKDFLIHSVEKVRVTYLYASINITL